MRKLHVSIGFLAVAAALVGTAAIAAPARAPSSYSFYLDSYNANDHSGGNTVTGPNVLAGGQSYTLLVEGTYSAWQDWPFRRCGQPEPAAVFPSPASDGQPATSVGDDAVFRFAKPLYSGTCKRHALPHATGSFQIDLGNGWKSFTPNGGIPRRPSAGTHPYTATILGTGVKPQFRIADWRTSDNNGMLKLTITS